MRKLQDKTSKPLGSPARLVAAASLSLLVTAATLTSTATALQAEGAFKNSVTLANSSAGTVSVTPNSDGNFTISVGSASASAKLSIGTPSKAVALKLEGSTIKVDDPTFSGRFSLPVTLTALDGSLNTTVVDMVVNPKPATALKYSNTIFAEIKEDGYMIETFYTQLSWAPSTNAQGYELRIADETPSVLGRVNSVSVKGWYGPASPIELRSIGNDGTKSEPLTFTAGPAHKLTINYTKTALALSTKAKQDIETFAAEIKKAKPSVIYISAGEGYRANLGASRAAVVKAYLAQQLRTSGFRTSQLKVLPGTAGVAKNVVTINFEG